MLDCLNRLVGVFDHVVLYRVLAKCLPFSLGPHWFRRPVFHVKYINRVNYDLSSFLVTSVKFEIAFHAIFS